jgi:hypothetical protein
VTYVNCGTSYVMYELLARSFPFDHLSCVARAVAFSINFVVFFLRLVARQSEDLREPTKILSFNYSQTRLCARLTFIGYFFRHPEDCVFAPSANKISLVAADRRPISTKIPSVIIGRLCALGSFNKHALVLKLRYLLYPSLIRSYTIGYYQLWKVMGQYFPSNGRLKDDVFLRLFMDL